MANKSHRAKLKSLSHGRPPIATRPKTISRKATRAVIRAHHVLEKRKAKALAAGDISTAETLTQQSTEHGGIQQYQQASLIGQSSSRGGDSSKLLMEWLKPVLPSLKDKIASGQGLRMLEIGALSTTNACSRSHVFEMTRIDLNSQAKGIEQQDFMDRELPANRSDMFDIISLSLVLNYVPDPAGRGEMLRRTTKFLRKALYSDSPSEPFPSLFLVLPAPCVINSRYLDEARLGEIMESLGYMMMERKLTNKLVYYLWRLDHNRTTKAKIFKKMEVNPGKARNNFAIVLQ
ncbi:putative methyltransferase-domain-containing protein [Xylogone sp. PMI_703]|nr:putative methyltransferase-domain-containing protein [Xylogone sp. PMI_703]